MAENQAEAWFRAKGNTCYRASVGNPDWDLKVNDDLINVKFSRGKKRNHNELEFFLHTMDRPCFTDYYLLMHGNYWNSKGDFNMYLIPAAFVEGQSQITTYRPNISPWIRQFQIYKSNN